MAILMVQLEPTQTYSAAGYLGLALGILTGFSVGITLLGIFGGRSPQEHLRRTLKDLLATLDRKLDQPHHPVSLAALDTTRDTALSEVARVDAMRRGGDPPPGAIYIPGIAGHYIGVARGLRTFAEALEAIDWGAWRLPRF